MTAMPSSSLRALLGFLCLVLVHSLPSQERTAEAASKPAELLAMLDQSHTDWIALQEVGERIERLGAAARPSLDAALAAAAQRSDRRYQLRLLAVGARLDTALLAELGGMVADEDSRLAALAARLLGRCGAAPAAVAKELMQQAEREQRAGVLSALALAAADAGCHALLPWLEQQLASTPKRNQHWLSHAHAILAVGTPAAKLQEWLASPSLRASAMLLARTCADAELEQPLLALLPQIQDEPYREWLLHSLGAIGGYDTRRALAMDLRSNPPWERSTNVDPRRLALLRLGDMDQRKWVLGQLRSNGWGENHGVTSQVVGPEMVQMAELLGKWGIVGAAAELATLTADQEVLLWTRSHAARGLCWLRDPRGLLAAASLLQQELTNRLDFPEAYTRCQETLHQFVGNADRPVYVPLENTPFQADPAVGSVGAVWQAWLAANAEAIVWRAPRFVDDLRLWP